MADHYELEAKSGKVWINAAKKHIDQSTRIVSNETKQEGAQFKGEPNVFHFYSHFT